MKSTPHRRRRRVTGTAGLALASAALAVLSAAACSSSGSSTPPASGTTAAASPASTSAGAGSSSAAASGQTVKLTFWTWVPNIDKVVALWNQAHPDIQVQVQVQAGGDALLTKLLTAAKAGNPPDIAQVEYQVLPTLVSNNYLADISKYDGNLKSDFPAGNWNQVTLGSNSLYGLPQDAAPMTLYYHHLGAVRRGRREAALPGARRVPRLVLKRRPR
jgi:ABC-type glycerol-3-phosphate transport system substrate-binding protein